jgi:hypothetical protein
MACAAAAGGIITAVTAIALLAGGGRWREHAERQAPPRGQR